MSITDWELQAGDVQANDDQLKRIADLVTMQVELERSIAETEASLKHLKGELQAVSEGALPTVLDEAGIAAFTTKDGRIVTMVEKMFMSIPRARRDACARWLVEHDLGSLVREDVVISFERGEEKRVAALQDVLEREGYSEWSVDESMNTGSVKAALAELMERGDDVPLEQFGGYIRRMSVVK